MMPVCSDSASVIVAVRVRASLITSISSDALAVAWASVRVDVFLLFIASCFLGHPCSWMGVLCCSWHTFWFLGSLSICGSRYGDGRCQSRL